MGDCEAWRMDSIHKEQHINAHWATITGSHDHLRGHLLINGRHAYPVGHLCSGKHDHPIGCLQFSGRHGHPKDHLLITEGMTIQWGIYLSMEDMTIQHSIFLEVQFSALPERQ